MKQSSYLKIIELRITSSAAHEGVTPEFNFEKLYCVCVCVNTIETLTCKNACHVMGNYAHVAIFGCIISDHTKE